MSCFLAILEDDDGRRAAMDERLADRFPQYPVRFYATAAEMIRDLRRDLPDALAISLDHDLDLIPVAGQRLLDSG